MWEKVGTVPYTDRQWDTHVGGADQDRPFFVGSHELSIDTKNRLSIPYQIRARLNATTHGSSVYVVPGARRGVLFVYPDRYFERLRATFPPEELLSPKARAFRQFELANTALIDPDSQGRILLPRTLIEASGIGREIMLAGVQDHMEIWNRGLFIEFQQQQWDSLAETRDEVLSELARLRASATNVGPPPAGTG